MQNPSAISTIVRSYFSYSDKGRRGRDRILVGFTTTCAISADPN